jgi:hypothetical protein
MRREPYETTVHGHVEEFRSAMTILEPYQWSPEHWSTSFGCGGWGSAASNWPIISLFQSAQHGPAPSPVTVPASHFSCNLVVTWSCRGCHRPVRTPQVSLWPPSPRQPCSHLGNRGSMSGNPPPVHFTVSPYHPITPGLPIISSQLLQNTSSSKDHPHRIQNQSNLEKKKSIVKL